MTPEWGEDTPVIAPQPAGIPPQPGTLSRHPRRPPRARDSHAPSTRPADNADRATGAGCATPRRAPPSRTVHDTMSTSQPSIIPTSATDANVRLDEFLKKYNMSLKLWKSIKAGGVSVMIGLLAWFAIENGADPTATTISAITALLALNGVELSEWLAAKQAIAEIQRSNDDE